MPADQLSQCFHHQNTSGNIETIFTYPFVTTSFRIFLKNVHARELLKKFEIDFIWTFKMSSSSKWPSSRRGLLRWKVYKYCDGIQIGEFEYERMNEINPISIVFKFLTGSSCINQLIHLFIHSITHSVNSLILIPFEYHEWHNLKENGWI